MSRSWWLLALALGCRNPLGPPYRYVTLCEMVATPEAPLVCRQVRCEVRDGRVVTATCIDV